MLRDITILHFRPFTLKYDLSEVPQRPKCAPKRTKVGPFGSHFATFLVIRVGQNDSKAMKLVENQSLWHPAQVSFKKVNFIE